MLNNKPISTLVVATVMLFLTGCGTTYNFNNQSFKTAELALGAHSRHLQSIEKALPPLETSSGGNVMIITPSKKTVEALGITRTGHPPKEIIDYLGNYMVTDYGYFAKFLEKSNLFSSVTHQINDFPPQQATQVTGSYDAVIYLDMKSPTQVSWFLLVPPSKEAVPVSMDTMADAGVPKIKSWIDDIYHKLKKN